MVKKITIFLKNHKNIIILWLGYLLLLNGFLLILGFSGLLTVKDTSLKELLFAVWGWGWDGMHYLKIAQEGYSFPLQAFFPLYPLVIRFADIFLPLTLAYRVNAVLLLSTLILLHRLMGYMAIPEKAKFPALLMLLAFPSAFYLQANYTETLYIFLSTIGLLFLLEKRYFYAAVFAGLLSATKISGISLGLVIVVFYVGTETNWLKSKPEHGFKTVLNTFLLTLISFSGLFAYFTYLDYTFGSYRIFFDTHSNWGRELINQKTGIFGFFAGFYTPLIRMLHMEENTIYIRLTELLAVAVSIFALVKSATRIRGEIYLFALLQVLIPLTSGTFLSFNRLVLLAFPLLLWIFAECYKKRVLYWSLVVLFFTVQFVGVYFFMTNVFVG